MKVYQTQFANIRLPIVSILLLITLLFTACDEVKIVPPNQVVWGYKEFWKDENFNKKPDIGEPYEDQNLNQVYDLKHDFRLYELNPDTGLYKIDENNKPVLFTGTVVATFPGGQKYYERNYKDGVLHGRSQRWTKDGIRVLDSNYFEGQLDGEYTEWYGFPVESDRDPSPEKAPATDKDGHPVPRNVTQAIRVAQMKFTDEKSKEKREEKRREWIMDQYRSGSFKVRSWGESKSLARAVFADYPSHESNMWMVHAFKSVAGGEFYLKKKAFYSKGVKVDKWSAFDEKGETMYEETYEDGILIKRELKQ